MMDTARLAVFIQSIDFNFNVTEELAALFPMKSTTNWYSLENSQRIASSQLQLNIKKLVSKKQ